MTATATPAFRHLDPSRLRQRISDRSVIPVVDVRTPGEFAATHLPGSLNLPLDFVRSQALDVAVALAGPVTLLCANGPRSEEAARILADHGVSDIEVLQGGIQGWQAAYGDVVTGKGAWAMERQVRLVAGSIVVAGIAASVVAPKAKWVSAAIGGGLTFSALSNTCGMARALSLLPYNRRGGEFVPTVALEQLKAEQL